MFNLSLLVSMAAYAGVFVMFPLLGGLMTGGMSLLGSMFSSDTSAKNTQAQIAAQERMQGQTEAFNAEQADLNRQFQSAQVSQQEAFQQQMSGTAYQRASADMKGAGLNPAMMFGSGSAASSPSGSAASGSTASVGTPTVPVSQSRGALAGIGEAVRQGLDAMVTAKTVDKMGEEISNLQAERLRTQAVTRTEEERPAEVRSHVMRQVAEEAQTRQVTTALKLDRARQEFEAIKYLDLSNIPDVARKALHIGSYGAGKVGDIIAPVVSSATRLGGLEILKKAMEHRSYVP